MRMVFGLAGIVVTLGVVVLIMKYVELPDIQAASQAQKHTNEMLLPMSGVDPGNGQRIDSTYDLFEEDRSDGKLQDFQVTRVDAGSHVAQQFGLKVNDVIVGVIDTHGVRTDMKDADSPQSAKGQILETCMNGGQLIVQRGDQQLMLPAAPAHASAAPPPPAQPNQNRPNPPQQQSPENDAVNSALGRIHPLGVN